MFGGFGFVTDTLFFLASVPFGFVLVRFRALSSRCVIVNCALARPRKAPSMPRAECKRDLLPTHTHEKNTPSGLGMIENGW
jgi:hypothetical protein